MASSDPSRDAFFSGTDNYLKCAFMAQRELIQLGMNLFHREMDAGQRIAGSRDFAQTFAAYADLMRGAVEDFSASTVRLFSQVSDAGAQVVEDTAVSAHQVSDLATEATRKVQETVDKAGQAVRESARRARKSGQSVVNQATAMADQVTETAKKADVPALEGTRSPVDKDK